MQFYTDPDFFFNLWYKEIMRETEAKKERKLKRRRVSLFLL